MTYARGLGTHGIVRARRRDVKPRSPGWQDGRVLPGFETRTVDGDGARIAVATAGDGPPLLLLHGYPQTRACWHRVAPALARRFTVVAADLRGYGDSDRPPGGDDHAGYSKRAMAADMVAVMRGLGHPRFAVAGHDRGGRVAHRMALDHPDVVERAAVLDIVPTPHALRRLRPGVRHRLLPLVLPDPARRAARDDDRRATPNGSCGRPSGAGRGAPSRWPRRRSPSTRAASATRP